MISVEKVVQSKFPFTAIIEETTQTSPIIMELSKITDSSSIMVKNQTRLSRSNSKSIKDPDITTDSLQVSSMNMRSHSYIRDERESTRGMLSRSTFDDQASFIYPINHRYLFDIEMNISNLFEGPKSCHLIVFVHGLLGNFQEFNDQDLHLILDNTKTV